MTNNHPSHFSLPEVEALVKEAIQETAKQYEKEINALNFALRCIEKQLIEATSPVVRGRPAKKSSLKKFLLSGLDNKKRGRPKLNENQFELITDWDSARLERQKLLNLKFLGDKYFIKILVQEKFPSIAEYKKRRLMIQFQRKIKSLRDTTSIRTRARNKTN